MKKETANSIGAVVITGLALMGAYALYKRYGKSNETKSSATGRTIFGKKSTKKAMCFCANNDPNKGGYFGSCPCEKGYYDAEKAAGLKFSGANGSTSTDYKGVIAGGMHDWNALDQQPNPVQVEAGEIQGHMDTRPESFMYASGKAPFNNKIIENYKAPIWTVGG